MDIRLLDLVYTKNTPLIQLSYYQPLTISKIISPFPFWEKANINGNTYQFTLMLLVLTVWALKYPSAPPEILVTGLAGEALWPVPVAPSFRLYQYLYMAASLQIISMRTLSPLLISLAGSSVNFSHGQLVLPAISEYQPGFFGQCFYDTIQEFSHESGIQLLLRLIVLSGPGLSALRKCLLIPRCRKRSRSRSSNAA